MVALGLKPHVAAKRLQCVAGLHIAFVVNGLVHNLIAHK